MVEKPETRNQKPETTPPKLTAVDRVHHGLWLLLGSGFWFLVSLLPCQAQVPGGEGVYYSNRLGFLIPFQADDRRIEHVQLYVSEDQGRSWKHTATVAPAARTFHFEASHDGWYWFTVRTVDKAGRSYPLSLEGVPPGLKVCVDTQRPVVSLKPLPSSDGTVGVEWQVRDENLDLEKLQLEYRPPGTNEWVPLAVQRVADGRRTWSPATNAPLEVRLQVKDLAGNLGEALTTVTPMTMTRSPQRQQGPPSDVHWVKSPRIRLNYDITNEGKSGVSAIELWVTRDEGRSWRKHDERPSKQPPYEVEVKEEGTYGFTLIARSGAGLSEPPPKVGDQPQVLVKVDLTPPVVRLLSVDVGRGTETGNQTIVYSATDENMERQPITISYASAAEETKGPWIVLAERLENKGRYVWRMPPDVPYKILIKVEAVDKAGNVGSAETTNPVNVDLSQPKVQIRDVVPVGK